MWLFGEWDVRRLSPHRLVSTVWWSGKGIMHQLAAVEPRFIVWKTRKYMHKEIFRFVIPLVFLIDYLKFQWIHFFYKLIASGGIAGTLLISDVCSNCFLPLYRKTAKRRTRQRRSLTLWDGGAKTRSKSCRPYHLASSPDMNDKD